MVVPRGDSWRGLSLEGRGATGGPGSADGWITGAGDSCMGGDGGALATARSKGSGAELAGVTGTGAGSGVNS